MWYSDIANNWVYLNLTVKIFRYWCYLDAVRKIYVACSLRLNNIVSVHSGRKNKKEIQNSGNGLVKKNPLFSKERKKANPCEEINESGWTNSISITSILLNLFIIERPIR